MINLYKGVARSSSSLQFSPASSRFSNILISHQCDDETHPVNRNQSHFVFAQKIRRPENNSVITCTMHIAIGQPRNPWTQHPRPIDRKVNIFNWGVGVAQKWWKIGVSRYCYAYMVCLNNLKMITNKMMKIVLKMKITLQGSSGSPQVHLSAKSEFFPQLLFAAPEVRIVNYEYLSLIMGCPSSNSS